MKNIVCFSLLFVGIWVQAQDVIHPKELHTEYMKNPVGIDVTTPKLGWSSTSKEQNQIQTAYQIMAATDSLLLTRNAPDLWNSGLVSESASVGIPYRGKPLESNAKVYWKVKLWDKNNRDSEWSEIASFSMGLLKSTDWSAQWIGYERRAANEFPHALRPIISARMFRKQVQCKKAIKRAVLHVSAAGLYEFRINGTKVGDAVLTPALSQTEKRMYYNTYEIAHMLKKGTNAFGVYVGAGRYTALRPLQEATGAWEFGNKLPTDTVQGLKIRYPKFIAQIYIWYQDGSAEVITTDQTWKVFTGGPIVRNNEYDGESYDGTREIEGWDMPNFDDSKWLHVDLTEAPSPMLSAENKEPIKIMEQLKPVSISELRPGVFILDMGQNMVGWIQLRVKGPRNTKVTLVFSELLKPDGSLYLDNMRTAEVTDHYTLKGSGKVEIWEPRFTYHGFRYVQITGFPGTPTIDDFTGKVVYDAVETVGTFECSDPIMTQLHKNAYWGIRGNYRSMPTDCPQRDERFGWLGDRSLESKGESYIFRNINLYRKWMLDIKDAMLDNGSIPDVAPTHSGMISIYSDGVVWPSCYVIAPALFYIQTGDIRLIENHFDAQVKWANYMKSLMTNGIMSRNTYGDWCMPPERLDMIWSSDPKRITSGGLLSTAYMYYDFKILASFAKILNKPEYERYFTEEALAIRNKFNKVFWKELQRVYDNNTMSSALLPLGMGITPAEKRQAVANNLVQRLKEVHQLKMGTGLIGGQWLMKTLSAIGRPDLAYTLATQREYPSWGYQIEKGATTIWELWNGDKARPDMNSGNHVMLLGDVITWMYENVAGIQSDETEVAFKKIWMQPDFTKVLQFAGAVHKSLYGPIKSNWKWKENDLVWNVDIPCNTRAELRVPAVSSEQIRINDERVSGVHFWRQDENNAAYSWIRLGSGSYEIHIKNVNLPVYTDPVFAPQIYPNTDTIIGQKEQKVSMTCSTPQAKIYYTLDGSVPNKNARLYQGPFTIRASAQIMARAYSEKDSSTIQAVSIAMLDKNVNGWNYKYYEGKWEKLPDFSKERLLSKGQTFALHLTQLAKVPDYFGIVFESNIQIEKDGNYNFYLASDDGAKLYVNNQLVANTDGTHGETLDIGSMSLKKGKYPIRVEYFEASGGQTLRLEWQSDFFDKSNIPANVLYLK